jgi:hypothetical protein
MTETSVHVEFKVPNEKVAKLLERWLAGDGTSELQDFMDYAGLSQLWGSYDEITKTYVLKAKTP